LRNEQIIAKVKVSGNGQQQQDQQPDCSKSSKIFYKKVKLKMTVGAIVFNNLCTLFQAPSTVINNLSRNTDILLASWIASLHKRAMMALKSLTSI
jgi:hypothetical protein